jgi:hypothetical protein
LFLPNHGAKSREFGLVEPERTAAIEEQPSKKFENLRTHSHYRIMDHLSDHDLERYHLGIVTDEAELAPLEEHFLVCPDCVARAEENAAYVDTLRAAIIAKGLDVED